jgi:hypothetical protein
MFRRVLGLSLAVAGLALCASAPGALANFGNNNNDVVCSGTAPASVQHDLIVPAGGSCIVLFGSTVGHDVIVNPGASLDDRGATIGHDVLGFSPLGVHVNGGGQLGGGSVGHDVIINGVTGTPFRVQEQHRVQQRRGQCRDLKHRCDRGAVEHR